MGIHTINTNMVIHMMRNREASKIVVCFPLNGIPESMMYSCPSSVQPIVHLISATLLAFFLQVLLINNAMGAELTGAGSDGLSRYNQNYDTNKTLDIGGGMGSCAPSYMQNSLATTQDLLNGNVAPPELSGYLKPSVSLSQVYSDNINLAPSGLAKSDNATIFTPGLSGCTTGSRLFANFNYTAQAIKYWRTPPANNLYSQFNGHVLGDLYADHLFLDVNTQYGQAVIDPLQTYSTNNVFSTTTNRTNVWNSYISPYWRQSLGSLGLMTLRYTYGHVVYSAPSLHNSTSEGASFNLHNSPLNTDWSWVANWDSMQVSYEGLNVHQYFDDASLEFGYQLVRSFRMLTKFGVEDDYLANGVIKRYASPYWSAGFKWKEQYASLKVMIGHRFFGRSYLVDAAYTPQNYELSASYTEMPTVASLMGMNGTGNAYVAPAISPVIDYGQLQNTQVFISKRAQVEFTYPMSRSAINLQLYDDRQIYQTGLISEYRTTGGSIGLQWAVTQRSQVHANFDRTRFSASAQPADYLNFTSIGWTYYLLPTATFSLNVNRQNRTSNVPVNDYLANSVWAAINATF